MLTWKATELDQHGLVKQTMRVKARSHREAERLAVASGLENPKVVLATKKNRPKAKRGNGSPDPWIRAGSMALVIAAALFAMPGSLFVLLSIAYLYMVVTSPEVSAVMEVGSMWIVYAIGCWLVFFILMALSSLLDKAGQRL